ncbi:MAG: polyphosphate-selective porin [Pseudomonadota bacterium]|jgi:phosphate-selective porin OprO/OprP
MIKKLALVLLGTVALSASAMGQARKPAPPSDPRIGLLEQQLRSVQQQLADIKARQDRNDSGGDLAELKRSTARQQAEINKRLDGQVRTSLNNGRLSFASADGAFTFALRSLVQFDYGYFGEGRNPPNIDLNSGSNFRRAQFGFTGTAWRDWSYNFTYDFGGNGIERSGYIYTAYLQYDGLKPFGLRIGAFSPFAGIDDTTGSGDLLFLERASVADIARNIGGAPGREGVSVFAQGDRYLVSVAYTGKRATDAATFDAQQAIVTRASWLAVSNDDVKWLLDANATHVLKVADTTPNTGATAFRFSNGPELAIDAMRTVDTGMIDARKVTQWGVETAATYGPLYAQAGYFRFNIYRRTLLPDPDFKGWYALATWSLTGETHPYDPASASFRSLRPAKPLGSDGGIGAWEIKVRYSNINLDYLPSLAPASGGVAGGVQNIWSVGLNWYPTNGIRFALDYDNIQVNHVGAPATDISANAIGLRSQISL